MTDQNQKKQDKRKRGLNPVAVAITGAVVGAGIAVAGVMALKDEKNREKVKKVLNNVKKQATDYAEDVQNKIRDEKEEAEKKLAEVKEKVKKVANSVNES